MIEYRFKYRPKGSVGSSLKYFVAESLKDARRMFKYACNRKGVKTEHCNIKKYNRWTNKWENT